MISSSNSQGCIYSSELLCSGQYELKIIITSAFPDHFYIGIIRDD